MRLVNIATDSLGISFATKAAREFTANPRLYTYAEGDPASGELLAIRWNDETVLIMEIMESEEPKLYQTRQLIGAQLPPMKLLPHHEPSYIAALAKIKTDNI